MPHILFIEANVPAINAMARAKQLGHRVSLVRSSTFHHYPDNRATSQVLASLDRCVDIPSTAIPEDVVDAVAKFIDEDPPHAVICQNEFAVESAAIACSRLRLPFTDVEGVRNARDKATARRLLSDAGLSTVRVNRTAGVADSVRAAEAIGYPVILKPVSGADSILAFRANNADETRRAAQHMLTKFADLPDMIKPQLSRGILVEEYLQGSLVSAEIGVLDGTFYRFMVSGRPRARENECIELGVFMPANISSDDRDQCFDYAEQVCRVLKLDHGIFHIEMMLGSRGPVLVEANPRLMGGVMPSLYQMMTSEDIHDYEISIHLRQHPKRKIPEIAAGYVTSRKLMPRKDCTLADPIDITWLDEFDGRIEVFHPYKLTSGADVMQNEVLARFVVRDRDINVATAFADELLERFERSLGVDLYH